MKALKAFGVLLYTYIFGWIMWTAFYNAANIIPEMDKTWKIILIISLIIAIGIVHSIIHFISLPIILLSNTFKFIKVIMYLILMLFFARCLIAIWSTGYYGGLNTAIYVILTISCIYIFLNVGMSSIANRE